MDARDLIRAGKLTEAHTQLISEIKSSPADLRKRTLLFQVLSFFGEWDKAERHLDIMATQDASLETGTQLYKNIINAERERVEVLEFQRYPSFLPKTPPYFEIYREACEKLHDEKPDEAKEIFEKIADQGEVSGTVRGESFTGFRDTDTYLANFLEAFVHERYVWVPFSSLRELVISPPKTLFDLLWIMARITTWEGLTLNCYLPVLYPGSFLHEDDRVKLGRMTDWISLGNSFSKGVGQHVFEVGDREMGILEIQEALFEIEDTKKNNEENN